jgi:putative peptide zinc metalloprotease protein
MSVSLFSPMWYRVAEEHPRLQHDVRIQGQGAPNPDWYLLVNAVTGKQVRINRPAYEFIGRCDGTRSVQQIWDALLELLRDDAPTQDEVIQVLNLLDRHGMLAQHTGTRLPKNDARAKAFVNPFALRIRLFDPSHLLQALDALAQIAIRPAAFWSWAALIAVGAGMAVSNFEMLRAHGATYLSSSRFVFLAWVSYPFIKLLHELGHALALRRWGGEIHEAGFTLFVLVPAPYVDASAAAALRYRHQRIVVGAAGIMVEAAIAAVALAVWLNVEPGLVRDFALVTAFIAGVSTLLINGNPLMPFDGYYLLCDAFDRPNLAGRSALYWSNLLFSCLTGRTPQELPASQGEQKWLLTYAPLAAAYRLLVATLLVLWLASIASVVGTAAGSLLVYLLVLRPLWKLAGRVKNAADTEGWLRGGALRALAMVGAALIFALLVPLPYHTTAAGVVWLPEQAQLRAGSDGFVAAMLAADGQRIDSGQLLVRLDNPDLLAEYQTLTSQSERLQAELYGTLQKDAVGVRNAEQELERVQSALRRAEDRIAQLEIRAGRAGRVAIPDGADLPGTFVRQGQLLGYVLNDGEITVRIAIPQDDAALVRDSSRGFQVRLAEEDGPALPAQRVGEMPAAVHELPSPALGEPGGGPYSIHPEDKNGVRVHEPVVLLDLRLPGTQVKRVGGRVWVRIEHDSWPLAWRAQRQLRQLLLKHFDSV